MTGIDIAITYAASTLVLYFIFILFCNFDTFFYHNRRYVKYFFLQAIACFIPSIIILSYIIIIEQPDLDINIKMNETWRQIEIYQLTHPKVIERTYYLPKCIFYKIS